MQIFTETDRLILREILPQDAKGMYELDSDPEVQRYLGNEPIQHIDEAMEDIEYVRQQYLDHGIGRWAVVEKQTKNFIGWAGLKFVTETHMGQTNYYDLGYRLIRKYWGKGYGTETASASLDYGFGHLLLPEMFAYAHTENTGSNRILKKLGFTLIIPFDYKGAPQNWYRIGRDEWLERHTLPSGK